MEHKCVPQKIICRFCKEQFDQPKSLFKHLQQKHSAGPALKHSRTCSICGVQCAKPEIYRDHMLHIHGQRSEPQKLTFKSLSEFLLWKTELEKEHSCQYVLQSAPKLLSSSERKYFYQCDSSEQDRPKSREKKNSSITKKTCSSMISVIEGTGILKVEYWASHSNHSSKNSHLIHPNELTTAISSLEMVHEMDVEEYEESFDNSSYSTEFVSHINDRSLQQNADTSLSSFQKGTGNILPSSESDSSYRKAMNSVLYSLASVACGKAVGKKVAPSQKLKSASEKSSELSTSSEMENCASVSIPEESNLDLLSLASSKNDSIPAPSETNNIVPASPSNSAFQSLLSSKNSSILNVLPQNASLDNKRQLLIIGSNGEQSNSNASISNILFSSVGTNYTPNTKSSPPTESKQIEEKKPKKKNKKGGSVEKRPLLKKKPVEIAEKKSIYEELYQSSLKIISNSALSANSSILSTTNNSTLSTNNSIISTINNALATSRSILSTTNNSAVSTNSSALSTNSPILATSNNSALSTNNSVLTANSPVVTNFIVSPQLPSIPNFSTSNKIIFTTVPAVPGMSYINVNNQLIPIKPSATNLTAAPIPIQNAASIPIQNALVGVKNVLNTISQKPLESVSKSVAAKTILNQISVPVSAIETSKLPVQSFTGATANLSAQIGKTINTNTPNLVLCPISQNSMPSATSILKNSHANLPRACSVNLASPISSRVESNRSQSEVTSSIVAKTVSSVVKETSTTFSVPANSLSKVSSIAFQLVNTPETSKCSTISISNSCNSSSKVSKGISNVSPLPQPKMSSLLKKNGPNDPTVSPVSVSSMPRTSTPHAQIPQVPNVSSGPLIFESAGNLYMLEPIENNINESQTPTHKLETKSQKQDSSKLQKQDSSKLQKQDSKTQKENLKQLLPVLTRSVGTQSDQMDKKTYMGPKSTSSMKRPALQDDSEILKKVQYYQLEMKYLSAQEECKRLKVELAKVKLKNKELSEKLEIEAESNISEEVKLEQKEHYIQAEELIKALEKRCGSDQDGNVYALMRTSVLRSLYADVNELCQKNEEQYKELKSYRDHDKFYKFLRHKLDDGEETMH